MTASETSSALGRYQYRPLKQRKQTTMRKFLDALGFLLAMLGMLAFLTLLVWLSGELCYLGCY